MNLAGDIETAHCSNPNTNKIAPHWIFCTSNPLLHLDMWGAVPTNGGIDWQKNLDRRTYQQKEKRDGAKTLRSPTHIWGYWGTNPRSKNTQTETEKGSMVLKSVSKNKQTHTHSYKKEKKGKRRRTTHLTNNGVSIPSRSAEIAAAAGATVQDIMGKGMGNDWNECSGKMKRPRRPLVYKNTLRET